jgi:hypothetical protein
MGKVGQIIEHIQAHQFAKSYSSAGQIIRHSWDKIKLNKMKACTIIK